MSADASLRGDGAVVVSEASTFGHLEEGIIECARCNPGWWLPIDFRIFIELQATRRDGATGRGVKAFEWHGILPTGGAVSKAALRSGECRRHVPRVRGTCRE